jgi:hypothetical protein
MFVGGYSAAVTATDKDQRVAGLATMLASLPMGYFEEGKRIASKAELLQLDRELESAQKEAETARRDVQTIIPLAHYNLASLYSLQNQTGSSLTELEKAIIGGKHLISKKNLEEDPDLANIRKLPEFKALLVKYSIFM